MDAAQPSMPWSFPSTSSYTMTLPFRRRSYTINEPDPSYQVVYLGNVLTVLAKGDGCVDKPLALIWKTYCAKTRPDMKMKLCIARSGLKAETKQQGLTEYWSHRITFCIAPSQYPRLFCWVYKHEGKRMKPELRCHAVLCRRASEPPAIALRLHDSLQSALREYKRDKVNQQNNRIYGTIGYPKPPVPVRRKLLQTGANNFRPPMNRSRSAPRLGSIEEDREAEEEELRESTCCADDEPLEVFMEPGTPTDQMEFGTGTLGRVHKLHVDIEMGNDIEKLRLDGHLLRQREPDSLSDESGYHEKSSLEGEDCSDSEPEFQCTAL